MFSKIVDALRGRKALSSDWQEDALRTLSVDLACHSLCGVKLGDDIQGLSGLGRCENHRSNWEMLEYPDKGLSFWAELDWVEPGTDRAPTASDKMHLETLIVYVKASPPTIRSAFSGDFLLDGRAIDLKGSTTPAQAIEILGEPFASGTDYGDEVLFYEFKLPAKSRWPVCEWQLCFIDGLLDNLELTPYPDLEDEQTRLDYGIEKEWPFDP